MTSEVPRLFNRSQVIKLPGIKHTNDRFWDVFDLAHPEHPIRWRFLHSNPDVATTFIVYDKCNKSASGFAAASYSLEQKNEIAQMVMKEALR